MEVWIYVFIIPTRYDHGELLRLTSNTTESKDYVLQIETTTYALNIFLSQQWQKGKYI